MTFAQSVERADRCARAIRMRSGPLLSRLAGRPESCTASVPQCFLQPFFCSSGYNVPSFTVTGITFGLTSIAWSEHLGRIFAGRRLGGPLVGDIVPIYHGPPWTVLLPDPAHTFPNPGPTDWIDPNCLEELGE